MYELTAFSIVLELATLRWVQQLKRTLDFLQTTCWTWQLHVWSGQLYEPQPVPEENDVKYFREIC